MKNDQVIMPGGVAQMTGTNRWTLQRFVRQSRTKFPMPIQYGFNNNCMVRYSFHIHQIIDFETASPSLTKSLRRTKIPAQIYQLWYRAVEVSALFERMTRDYVFGNEHFLVFKMNHYF